MARSRRAGRRPKCTTRASNRSRRARCSRRSRAALLAERLHEEHPRERRITTTIDAELQRALEARVGDYLARLPERTSAALLVVDNATLEARAYVGSAVFGDQARLGHVDMVRASRSPGSTLKPFLYGLALDDGLIDSESLLVDAPQSFGTYRPGNFDMAYNGPVGAAEALRLSLNVPAVDLLDRVGADAFRRAARERGARPAPAARRRAESLGDPRRRGVRMEDLVGAYVALNRGGIGGTRALHAERRRADRAARALRRRRMDRARHPRSESAAGLRAGHVRPRLAPARRVENRHELRIPRRVGRRRNAGNTRSPSGSADPTARRCRASTAP